ncbi:MAG: hypothetical protein Q7U53_03195 [Anaerolineaceae bacterium]|nr:hypothetical protein [Anaerolineaceae bacterium]
MRRFIGTILVVLICLVGLSTSVQAQTPTPVPFIVPPGGIAIIGFNFDEPDQFAFVCLVNIPDKTEIRFTDNGWMSTNIFRTGESILSWYTPGGCEVGQIVNINLTDTFHRNNTTNEPFDLSPNGDQILVYQQYLTNPPTFIFALNSELTTWQTSATNANTSANPFGLDSTKSIALDEIDNSIYTGPKSFNTTADALAAIVNKAIWSGSNDVRQTMPSGSFSFTTTAVEVSDFRADTGGENAPWWVLVGVVVIAVVVMVVKRPKRECCK